MSEPKSNVLPAVPAQEDEGAKSRKRARTMSRKEMARMFRQENAAGGLDPELQGFMAELDQCFNAQAIEDFFDLSETIMTGNKTAKDEAQKAFAERFGMAWNRSLGAPVRLRPEAFGQRLRHVNVLRHTLKARRSLFHPSGQIHGDPLVPSHRHKCRPFSLQGKPLDARDLIDSRR